MSILSFLNPFSRRGAQRAAATNSNAPRGAARGAGGKTRLGANVLDTSRNRRKISVAYPKSGDETLTERDREKLLENARDSDLNWSVARWMIERHLDFVANFSFHCRAADRVLRRDVEAYIHAQERKATFDAVGINRRSRWFRTFEARKVLDGDVFGIRTADGMQAQEAETCRSPGKPELERARDEGAEWFRDEYLSLDRWTDGVFKSPAGRPLAYAFATQARKPATNDWRLERVVPADRVWHHAHYGHRFRATRGHSQILSGLESLIDTYDVVDLAKARTKVEQLFALAFYRTADDAAGTVEEVTASTTVEEGETAETTSYTVDFGKGPVVLDLDPGDRAEFLSSANPASSTQEFIRDLIQLCLASLDIPRSWWQANWATFHGSRSESLVYLMSCGEKRADLIDFLTDWSDWQLETAFASGDLLRPSDGRVPYVWQPAGVAWWNPSQEIAAAVKELDARLISRQRLAAENRGIDWLDVQDELDAEEEEIRRRRAALDAKFPPPAPVTPGRQTGPADEPETTPPAEQPAVQE